MILFSPFGGRRKNLVLVLSVLIIYLIVLLLSFQLKQLKFRFVVVACCSSTALLLQLLLMLVGWLVGC